MAYDISTLGECLIDCVPEGVNESGVPIFSANPGGAPANLLAMFSVLGGKTAFIGKVGDDGFGRSLCQNLKKAGIDYSGLIADKNYNTTLAMVHLSDSGDRSFSFYRKGCADIMLSFEEIDSSILTSSQIFHFGSVSLTDEPARSATLKAALFAKQNGAIISYDPNFRPLLWDDIEDAKRLMRQGAAIADIIKVSDGELELITGETDYLKGAEKLMLSGASLVFVTLGADGAFYCNKNANGLLKAYDVAVVDTTGSGDAFFGAVLWKLKDKDLSKISKLSAAELEEITAFGNAAGSLTATKKGAIPAMPTLSDIKKLINYHLKGAFPKITDQN